MARHAKAVGLMTSLTVCRKNLLASVVRRKLSLLAAARSARHGFLRRGGRTHRIESAAGEISRVTTEVRAAKENRQSVDRNQPHRQWLSADARFSFLTLHRRVHLLHVGLFAVIHSLSGAKRRFRFVVHCVTSWEQQAILRLQERVKHLGPLARRLPQSQARLPLI